MDSKLEEKRSSSCLRKRGGKGGSGKKISSIDKEDQKEIPRSYHEIMIMKT
jgi:hypothetical protein